MQAHTLENTKIKVFLLKKKKKSKEIFRPILKIPKALSFHVN